MGIFAFSVPISCGFKSFKQNFPKCRRVGLNYADFYPETLTFNQTFNLPVTNQGILLWRQMTGLLTTIETTPDIDELALLLAGRA